jgi:hypothetical protein
VLTGKPTFIIRREDFSYLRAYPAAEAFLADALRGYVEIGRNGDLVVYMIRNP